MKVYRKNLFVWWKREKKKEKDLKDNDTAFPGLPNFWNACGEGWNGHSLIAIVAGWQLSTDVVAIDRRLTYVRRGGIDQAHFAKS